MNKLQKNQSVENTNIDLISKQTANKNSKSHIRGVHYSKEKRRRKVF